MDKLKKLQDLSNLQSEPSLVLYERVEETLDKIDQLTEKVEESRQILLDKKKLKELLTPVYGVDYLTDADIERISAEILAKATPIKNKDYFDGKDGKDGKNGADGKDGKDGDDGLDGRDGKDGENGKDGKDGKDGKTPDHEWLGSKLRFKKPDGEWGKWVDLRGKDGKGTGVTVFGRGGSSVVLGNNGTYYNQVVSRMNFVGQTITDNGGGTFTIEDKNNIEIDLQNQFSTSVDSSYMEITTEDSDGNPTLIEYWDNSDKDTLLYSKEITYTSGDPTAVVVTDEISGKVMTTTIAYSSGEFLNKTITIT